MATPKKKITSKKQVKSKPKARVAKAPQSSLLSRAPGFNKPVVLLVVGLVILVAIVYLFITYAGTVRYEALQPVKKGTTAGATLPIAYNASSLTGTIRYVAPNGSNTSACAANDPCTLVRAVSQITTANSTIVLAGGVYRDQANIAISGSGRNGLRIVAESGKIPELRGSVPVNGGWVTEGSYKYIPYKPRPVELSQEVHFETLTDMRNLTGDGAGRFADQVWIGNAALDQVAAKTSLGDGKFYVDTANNRLYLTSTDAGKSGIETSRPGDGTTNPRDRLFSISSTGVTIEGIRINRYSANGDDYGVILLNDGSAHNFTMKQSELSDAPYEGVHVGLVDNPTFKNVTMYNVGWQTINANQSDKLLLDQVKITATDPFDEFASSPASGALKTSRTRDTKVIHSYIANNKSHGLWFDQSNINVVVDKNFIKDNSGAGVFFEISDGLTMTNNYVFATTGQPVKLAGSSGLRLVNNTIVGGYDPIGVYVDGRSVAGCSTNASLCKSSSPSSDKQGRFASSLGTTMDWMPRIDVMVNNIIAYPIASSGAICGKTVSVGICVTTSWSGTTVVVPLETIIHKADTSRGIPQTIIDGNVYANGSTRIIQAGNSNYTTVAAWTSALAGLPVGISGLDANGKSGNSWVNTDGTGTDSLVNANSQAYKIPVFTGTNAIINTYIPVGTQQYGALNSVVSQTPTPTTTTTVTPTPTTTSPTTPPPTNHRYYQTLSTR
jgi:hypothetical protein